MQFSSFELFLSLLHNAGMLALVVMAYSTTLRWTAPFLSKGVLVGTLFGIAGMISMLDPIRTPEGVQLDTRTVMAALAGPFGGLWSAIIAGAIMGTLRLMQGGIGAPTGLIAIIMAASIGYVFHRIWRRGIPSVRDLAMLSVAVTSILAPFALLPRDVAIVTLQTAGVPLVASSMVGIMLLGSFLIREERLAQREQKLKTEATTDALTSLANRRTFDRLAYKVSAGARERNSPFAMLLIDIDRFKLINDRFGHQTGDVVLAEVAHIVQDETRKTDIVARYGGEEIAVLMPATSVRVAQRVAERVRIGVAQRVIQIDEEALSVTVSIGVSGGYAASTVFPSIFKAADDALYAAKNGGRNRVETKQAEESRAA